MDMASKGMYKLTQTNRRLREKPTNGIRANIANTLFIFALCIFNSTGALSLTETTYRVGDNSSPIFIKKWAQVENIEYTKFENSGLDLPVNSLLTFFYLSKQDRKQEIIDMHYSDGSRDYIEKMLKKTPDAFTGAKNLTSLNIENIRYWGNHRLVEFTMTDKFGDTVGWAEDFVCEDGQCLKSNLVLFNQTENNQLFYSITNSALSPVVGFKPLSNYKKILLQPKFSPNPKYPVTIYIDLQAISNETTQLDWYKKLSQLKKVVEQNSSPSVSGATWDVKYENIKRQLSHIYPEWDKSDYENDNLFLHSRFSRSANDAHYLVMHLLGRSTFEIDSYIESADYVWIFIPPWKGEHDRGPLIFLYNKNKKSFDFELSYKNRNNKSIDRILRSSLIADGLFDVDEKEKKTAVTAEDGAKPFTTQLPEKNKPQNIQQFTQDAEKQNNNLYFWRTVFILCIFALVLLGVYMKKVKK